MAEDALKFILSNDPEENFRQWFLRYFKVSASY